MPRCRHSEVSPIPTQFIEHVDGFDFPLHSPDFARIAGALRRCDTTGCDQLIKFAETWRDEYGRNFSVVGHSDRFTGLDVREDLAAVVTPVSYTHLRAHE